MILVDAAGENMIAVAPGANERLTAGRVTELLADRVAAGTVILASLEVPLAAVSAAARGRGGGGRRGAGGQPRAGPGPAARPGRRRHPDPERGRAPRRLPPAGDDGDGRAG